MIPAIPYSFGSITSFTISSSTPSKESSVSRSNAHGGLRKSSPFQPGVIIPHSLTFTLLRKHKIASNHSSRVKVQALASVGSEVAIDEPNPTIAEVADAESPAPVQQSEASSSAPKTTNSNQGKRPRTTRKSDMPPVKNEDLLPGASFAGKVRSIQPFGAFVDFGAFTDGLVHVSNLSSGFVKDVASFVSVGQEVKVKILEANMETGRISLTMRDGEETSRSAQRGDEVSESFNKDNKPRTPRKNASRTNNQKRDGATQKTSKFVKGQVLDGTVKNLTRSGAYISLPEGEEGFLPSAEESEGFSIMGSSSLVVGQEVNVRVLRITRGQVTLTMKKEEDLAELNKMLNQGVVYAPRNPFELAFRKNKDIASFLDEREKVKDTPEPVVVSQALETVEETTASEIETLEESVVPSDLVDVSGSLSEEPSAVETAASADENNVVSKEESVASVEAVAEVNTEEAESVAVPEESSIEAVAEEEKKEAESAAVAEEEDKGAETVVVAEEDKKEAEPAMVTEEENKEVEPAMVTEEENKEVEPATVAEEEKKESEPAAVAEEEKKESEPAAVAEEEEKEAEPAAAVAVEAKEEQVTEESASVEVSPTDSPSVEDTSSGEKTVKISENR